MSLTKPLCIDLMFFRSFPGKGNSIRSLQTEILQKSAKLEGLEEALQDLLAKLRKKVHDLTNCQV